MLISPLPGTSRDNLLQTLSKITADVRDLYKGGAWDTLGLALGYLKWANEAVGKLSGQVSARDIDRLVLTRRHEQILSNLDTLALPATAPFSNGLLQLELETRTREFEAATFALGFAISVRAEADQHVVFDTTMFVKHPDKLKAIDFAELTEVWNGPINLMVPMVVIDELDRLKESRDPHVRWRAGYSLAVIDQLFPEGRKPYAVLHEPKVGPGPGERLRQRVTVEILFDPPGHVRLEDEDDEIVDRTVTVQPLVGSPVWLFTYDTGQSLRGRNAGLKVEKLTKPLGEEPSAEEQSRRGGRRPGREQRGGQRQDSGGGEAAGEA